MTTPTSQNSGRQSRKNIVFPNAMILPKNSLPPPSEGTTRGGITMPKQAFFPFTSFRRGKSPYPVWTNSQRADWGFGAREIQPPKHPTEERKRLARLYRKARRWKARNPKIMTQGALRVFEALCFDFANVHTGQLFPSHSTIAKRCGLGITCVKDALKRLRELGLIHWQRRCIQAVQALGGFILKQVTNLYTILPTAVWD